MILLDCGRDYSFHADAVAAHHNRNWFAILVQHRCTHRLRVFRAELEDMTDLHAFENFKRAGLTVRTSLAGLNCAQFKPLVDRNVSRDLHTAQVMIVFVCPRGHIAPVPQRSVSDNAQLWRSRLCTDSAKTSRTRAEQISNLFGMRWTNGSSTQTVGEFRLVKLMIAAD